MGIRKYLANIIKAQLYGEQPMELPEQITVQEIVRIAKANHMSYLLLGALIRTKSVSEEEKTMLRGMIMNSVMKTAVQVSELKELEKEFEEKQIKNQPLKGARLKFMYPSPEMREMSDIDVLVERNDMEKAQKVLKEMGYQAPENVRHHDVYKKPPFMVIELHHDIYDKTVDEKQYHYFEGFSKARLREGKNYTYDFGVEDFYVYMIAHMAKHFYAKGCGIRNLVDIYVYLSKYEKVMDREYLDKELEHCGIFQFTIHMEKLAQLWLEDGHFDEFYSDLFDYMLDCGSYGKDENGIWSRFAKEELQNDEIDRLRLKKMFIFPSISYMKENYPWLEKRPFLLPVAWIKRGWKGIRSKSGTRKCEMIQEIESETIRSRKRIYQNMGLQFKRYEDRNEG